MEAEKRAVGRPKLSLFTSYFRYCGGLWFGVAWATLSALWQALTVAQSFTLKVGWAWLGFSRVLLSSLLSSPLSSPLQLRYHTP